MRVALEFDGCRGFDLLIPAEAGFGITGDGGLMGDRGMQAGIASRPLAIGSRSSSMAAIRSRTAWALPSLASPGGESEGVPLAW